MLVERHELGVYHGPLPPLLKGSSGVLTPSRVPGGIVNVPADSYSGVTYWFGLIACQIANKRSILAWCNQLTWG